MTVITFVVMNVSPFIYKQKGKDMETIRKCLWCHTIILPSSPHVELYENHKTILFCSGKHASFYINQTKKKSTEPETEEDEEEGWEDTLDYNATMTSRD